jgi:hypothetical protein
MTSKERLIKRLKSLKQYKDLSQDELEKVVDKKLEEDELINSFVGLNEKEKEKALQLYDKYIGENSFENLAEKSSLTNLVYLEALNDRIKLFIEKEDKNKDGAVPIQMVEQLISNNEQIMKLKDQLGMMKDKTNNSFIVAWEELKKKALTYYSEHCGSTIVKCPYCQQLFHLLMNIDNLTAEKSSFFKGTMLYNLPLLNLYHQKRITKEEVADILGVHAKYVDFIYSNLYLKELSKNEEK